MSRERTAKTQKPAPIVFKGNLSIHWCHIIAHITGFFFSSLSGPRYGPSRPEGWVELSMGTFEHLETPVTINTFLHGQIIHKSQYLQLQ